MQKLLIILATIAVVITAAFGASGSQAAETSVVTCVDGMAGEYPCRNVNLLSHLTLADLGAQDDTIKANKHWGWIDPDTGREYVIFGLTNATSFVDISDPVNPIFLGQLPSHQGISQYRDFAVYGNYLFVVADNPTQHGLQVFDLTDLRN
ncbi:MAG: choice-of-anchor B family protein, partial [Anaerolineae bacterium]|nr:choice-of-anchor B family protein [Anaerolineae bacterium]